jgi:hypothetical protein
MVYPRQETYQSLDAARERLAKIQKNAALRNWESHWERTAARAKKTTWMQTTGWRWWKHEISLPYNRELVMGLSIVSAFWAYLYVKARNSESAKRDSWYWQTYDCENTIAGRWFYFGFAKPLLPHGYRDLHAPKDAETTAGSAHGKH